MADGSHYGKHRGGDSRQGTYVFTSNGQCLASINDLSADAILKTLKRGLRKWKQLPADARRTKDPASLAPQHRWEQFYPRDGLVFSIHSRDLPKSAGFKRLPTWNRDTAWFSKEEVAEMVPGETAVGDTFEFPTVFVQRLARFHFVDLVKGQTDDFHSEQTAGTRISGRVKQRDGDDLIIEVSGSTSGKTDGRRPRGVKTKLLGTAVYDSVGRSFRKFEMVAIGERWGRTRYNDRRQQPEATPIGFVFEMAEPDATATVPGIIWSYDAPWIKGPEE